MPTVRVTKLRSQIALQLGFSAATMGREGVSKLEREHGSPAFLAQPLFLATTYYVLNAPGPSDRRGGAGFYLNRSLGVNGRGSNQC